MSYLTTTSVSGPPPTAVPTLEGDFWPMWVIKIMWFLAYRPHDNWAMIDLVWPKSRGRLKMIWSSCHLSLMLPSGDSTQRIKHVPWESWKVIRAVPLLTMKQVSIAFLLPPDFLDWKYSSNISSVMELSIPFTSIVRSSFDSVVSKSELSKTSTVKLRLRNLCCLSSKAFSSNKEEGKNLLTGLWSQTLVNDNMPALLWGLSKQEAYRWTGHGRLELVTWLLISKSWVILPIW